MKRVPEYAKSDGLFMEISMLYTRGLSFEVLDDFDSALADYGGCFAAIRILEDKSFMSIGGATSKLLTAMAKKKLIEGVKRPHTDKERVGFDRD